MSRRTISFLDKKCYFSVVVLRAVKGNRTYFRRVSTSPLAWSSPRVVCQSRDEPLTTNTHTHTAPPHGCRRYEPPTVLLFSAPASFLLACRLWAAAACHSPVVNFSREVSWSSPSCSARLEACHKKVGCEMWHCAACCDTLASHQS